MIKWNPELYGRSCLSLLDFTDNEMLELIDLAIELKARRRAGVRGDLLHRRHIALIFEKSSTRTRTSASIAVRDEGGTAEYLSQNDIHLGVKESVKDTARVLGRTFDGILFRGFSQKRVKTLAEYAGIPVWNGLTDEFHPTQILADLMTIKEKFGKLRGLKVAYVGDGRNNVANSLMLGCVKAGINFANCTPGELMPDPELIKKASVMAAENGAAVEVCNDPSEGVKGANVIYTDVWVSMGEESEKEKRLSILQPYQINMDLVRASGVPEDEFIFLHCLPAFHDCKTAITEKCGALEVTDDVFEAPFSKVFDEAENRMHTIKALYVSALADGAAL
ncbi:MAG: ornithine carbamoyltransferase [Kiritimatiellia bacterium]